MTLADILRAGKANIERLGWAQGDDAVFIEGSPHGCCVATSMGVYAGVNFGELSMDATLVFKRANGIDKNNGVGNWNDDPARTKEEVLTAFDKAIALAEQESAAQPPESGERRAVMAGGLFSNLRCDDCGRFTLLTGGVSSAMIFDFVAMCPDYEHARCPACTESLGPVKSNARPSNGDMTPYQTVHQEPRP